MLGAVVGAGEGRLELGGCMVVRGLGGIGCGNWGQGGRSEPVGDTGLHGGEGALGVFTMAKGGRLEPGGDGSCGAKGYRVWVLLVPGVSVEPMGGTRFTTWARMGEELSRRGGEKETRERQAEWQGRRVGNERENT